MFPESVATRHEHLPVRFDVGCFGLSEAAAHQVAVLALLESRKLLLRFRLQLGVNSQPLGGVLIRHNLLWRAILGTLDSYSLPLLRHVVIFLLDVLHMVVQDVTACTANHGSLVVQHAEGGGTTLLTLSTALEVFFLRGLIAHSIRGKVKTIDQRWVKLLEH